MAFGTEVGLYPAHADTLLLSLWSLPPMGVQVQNAMQDITEVSCFLSTSDLKFTNCQSAAGSCPDIAALPLDVASGVRYMIAPVQGIWHGVQYIEYNIFGTL